MTLPPGLLRHFIRQAEAREFSPGNYVCLAGLLPPEVHLVRTGTLELLAEDSLEAVQVTCRGRGELVGELPSDLEPLEYVAVRALSHAQTWCWPQPLFAELALEYPTLSKLAKLFRLKRNKAQAGEFASPKPRLARPHETGPRKLELGRLLGSGGASKVYAAQLGEKKFAVKVLSDCEHQTRLRTMREVRIGTHLEHPHIVRYFSSTESPEGEFRIVMELLEGQTLRSFLDQTPRPPLSTVLRIGRELASALDYLGQRGLSHRDVKPSNIFMTRDGSTKLLDFGISKGGNFESVTLTPGALGTPAYMAPEQLEGGTHPRQDQYSLGLVLWEMLAGRRAFAQSDPIVLIAQRLRESPPSLANLRPELSPLADAALARMTTHQPEERFCNCLEALQALAHALLGGESQSGWDEDTRSCSTSST